MADQTGSQEIKLLDRNPTHFTDEEARQIALDLYGLEGDLSPLVSERDANFRIRTKQVGSFVLKLANAGEDPGDIDFQIRALMHIEERDPELQVPRVVPTKTGDLLTTVKSPDGSSHAVHMLTFLPGTSMATISGTPALWRSLGETIARMNLALRGFFHSHGRRAIPWDITRCTDLRPHTVHISDPTARRNIETIMDHMAAVALPKLNSMRHQVIHADANPDNALADPNQLDKIVGIIDFGDMIYAPIITDLAIATTASILVDQDLERLSALVSGFDSIMPLEEQEIDLLYDLILARRALTAIIIAWRKVVTPDQPAYLQDWEQPVWEAIANLMARGRYNVSDRLRSACRFPPYVPVDGDDDASQDASDLLARRRDVLGSHLSLFYDKPLHIERGRGPWLHDARGKSYLDAYNNVPVTGHCHPHVVKAIERQTAALNTNTRYLYRSIVEYAERLTALFPEDLSVCMFVNSGSEANDIAWRMARFTAGARGALVMEHAYHGITEATADLSASEWTSDPPHHVRTLVTPDPYRGPYRSGEPRLGDRYAADTDRAIAELAKQGMKPAAFMVDTAFASSGIPDIPEGYLSAVVDKVHAAGGLLIADEVQAGYGRCGTDMWGYVAHDVMPDIVTLGKPVGSGYPLGVIITRREILEPFAEATDIFSTFGGNPVACAAGMAVLDVIENEELISNALETGDYLRQGIRALMARHILIGDVRGRGLLVGVELVLDRASLEPAPAETARLLDLLREQGMLIGRIGPLRNVLKIRPPLVFRRQHADLLIGALDRSLAKL